MSSNDPQVTNATLLRDEEFLVRVTEPLFVDSLRDLQIDWGNRKANSNSALTDFLVLHGYVERSTLCLVLTQLGLLFLSRLCIDFKREVEGAHRPFGSYNVKRVLSIGKNSALFLAEHSVIQSQVVLKFIRPGAADNIVGAVRTISSVDFDDVLIKPIDLFPAQIKDIFDSQVEVQCVVFPFVQGQSLREFLDSPYGTLSPRAVECFIRQVGGVLQKLESIGAYHGDLHDENIVVTSDPSRALAFRVIDVSFGAIGSRTPAECIDNDLINFQRHIWKILSVQQRFLPRMSIRKYLGARLFRLITKVISSETQRFSQVSEALDDDADFVQFAKERKVFLDQKFRAPNSFRLQRYEEISDPAAALKLFVPYPELMTKIMQFGNVYVSGNRGSGKSTYLAALAFFPGAGDTTVDFRSSFGVYFPCRQGEFRPLADEGEGGANQASKYLKHVVIVKIVRRVLELIRQGLDTAAIRRARDLEALRAALRRFSGGHALSMIGGDIRSEIANLVSAFMRVEMKMVEQLGDRELVSESTDLANESDLQIFLQTLRATFDELSATQFHILFDDAGEPFVPASAQRVFNDLILSSNAIYCVKFTAEKNTYTLTNSTGKILEIGHDYFEHDISAILFLGDKNTGLAHEKLEAYFRRIVERRLEYFEFQSTKIVDYLGDDQIKYEQLINSLATGRRNAYYSGWSMVWHIADRTPRNLLELVSEIFSAGEVDQKSDAGVVAPREQNRAIRTVSEKRLQSLTQIGGLIRFKGKPLSVGRRLFDVASVVGSIFKVYLKLERGKKRKEQHLAIERNDSSPISPDARAVLDRLVTFGVLDDAKMEAARDDEIKKPVYVLNRIFCPAFGIAFRRDRHLRLSSGKLEQLLLNPERFMTEGTRVLRNAANGPGQSNLLFELE